MNKVIKEIAQKAFSFKYKTAPNELNPGHHMDHINLFADLIVQECIDLLMKPEFVMENPNTKLSEYNKGWVNGRLLAIEHIKEHFRVKE